MFVLSSVYTSASLADSASYRLGPKEFAVPPGYFMSYYGPANPDGSGSAVAFRALLPGLKPITSENAAEFAPAAKARNLIIAFIYYKSPLTSDEFLLSILKNGINQTIQPIRNGNFLAYEMGGSNSNRVLYINQAHTSPLVFACPKAQNRWDGGITLSCDVIDALDMEELPKASDGRYPLVINYSFPKAYLADVETIDAQIKALVNSFEKPIK